MWKDDLPPCAEFCDFDEIRTWIGEIKEGCEKAGLRLEWIEINNRQLGRQSIPQRIIISDIKQLSSYLGKNADFDTFNRGRTELLSAFPELEEWSIENPFKLIENTKNIGRLVKILGWVREHPCPDIYLRQLSIPGVDTKFIERHKNLLGSWLDIVLKPSQIDKEYTGAGKHPLAQLNQAKKMGIEVSRGDPRDNLPGTRIVLPRGPEQIGVVDVDLAKIRISYLKNVTHALAEDTVLKPIDYEFLALETRSSRDHVEEMIHEFSGQA